MPNWVANSLIVRGEAERIDQFLKKVVNRDGKFDFNCLIPQPELTLRCLINEDIVRAANNYVNAKAKTPEEAKRYLAEFEERYFELTYDENWKDRKVEIKFPVIDWYEWNIANWGTKWNACRQEIEVTKSGNSAVLEITFDTAWSPPIPVIEKIFELAQHLDLEVEYYFREETEFHTTAYLNKTWYILLDYDSLVTMIETEIDSEYEEDTVSGDQMVERITGKIINTIKNLIREYKGVPFIYIDQHDNKTPLDLNVITDVVKKETEKILLKLST